MQFMRTWREYIRAVDNCIDEGFWDAEHLADAFAKGCECYSTPFFRKHVTMLMPVIISVTSTYADSIQFERSPELWKRQWADVLRHADGQIVCMMSFLCGGWAFMRSLSPVFLVCAYEQHKLLHGVPT